MAQISDLPYEIAEQIAEGVADNRTTPTLAALSATCRRFYAIANPLLYASVVRDAVAWDGEGGLYKLRGCSWVVNWATAHSQPDTLAHALFAPGASAAPRWSGNSIYILGAEGMPRDWRRFEPGLPAPAGPPSHGAFFHALHLAAAAPSRDDAPLVAVVTLLLDHGADAQQVARGLCRCRPHDFVPPLWPPRLWTALHYAICHGHAAVARLLVARGASVVEPDRGGVGTSALHSAAACGAVSLLEFFVRSGCALNHRDTSGATALNYAVKFADCGSGCIEELARMGADLEAGETPPLYEALFSRNSDAALRLMVVGARIDRTCRGYAPLHLVGFPTMPGGFGASSSTYNWRTLVSVLLENGADVNAVYEGLLGRGGEGKGNTPLMVLAQDPVTNLGLTKYLIDAGADVRAQNACGQTALSVTLVRLVSLSQRPELDSACGPIQLLLDHGASLKGCRRLFDDLFDLVLEKSGNCFQQHTGSFWEYLEGLSSPKQEPWIWFDDAIERHFETPGIGLCRCEAPHLVERLIRLSTRAVPREVLDEALFRCVDHKMLCATQALMRCGAMLHINWTHFVRFGEVLAAQLHPDELERVSSNTGSAELGQDRVLSFFAATSRPREIDSELEAEAQALSLLPGFPNDGEEILQLFA